MKKFLAVFGIVLTSSLALSALAYSRKNVPTQNLQTWIHSHLDVAGLPPVRCYAHYRSALVRFSLQPGGILNNAQLAFSSLNPAYDSAAINAVLKSSPLPANILNMPLSELKVPKTITMDFSDMLHLHPPASFGQKRSEVSCRIEKTNL